LRFIDNNAKSQEQWPPLNTSADNPVSISAIEIVIQLKDWGEIRRLYAMK
jgi:hypothetical protein